jgi:integrase
MINQLLLETNGINATEPKGKPIDVNILRYKLKNTQTTRTYLSEEELDRMYEYYTHSTYPKYKKVIKMFLIGCYTGLRYSDIVKLRPENIVDDVIHIQMSKSTANKHVRIPVVSKAKILLETYPYIDKVSNVKCNLYLKEIAKLLAIKKHLVFHCSRHTFATMALNYGISVEVVSSVLGHSDIRTTQLYAKILEQTTFDEMKKFK